MVRPKLTDGLILEIVAAFVRGEVSNERACEALEAIDYMYS